jgi:hypothetical protein
MSALRSRSSAICVTLVGYPFAFVGYPFAFVGQGVTLICFLAGLAHLSAGAAPSSAITSRTGPPVRSL